MVEVGVLGTLRVIDDDGDRTPTSSAVRRLIVALALRAPHEVSTAALTEALWGAAPPATAASALRTHLSAARRVLGPDGLGRTPHGYRLGPSVRLDIVEFEEMAASSAGEALALWRGRPAEPLSDETWFRSRVAEIEERHRVVEERWSADLFDAGIAVDHLEDLWRLARAEPMREQRWVVLVRTLRVAGRGADAVQAFEEARQALAESLGIRPGPDLLAAYDEVFATAWPVPTSPPITTIAPTRLVGRRCELARIESLLDAGLAVTTTGIGGIGKSRLAHEVALRTRARGEVAWQLSVPVSANGERVVRDLAAQAGATSPSELDATSALVARLADVDLLVVDGAEGAPAPVGALVARVSRRRPRLRILVTSRVALGHDGEVIVALAPLDVGGVGDPEGTAVELLGLLRGVTDPHLDPDLVDDARSTGGVPLLVELASRIGPSAENVASDAERVRLTALELIGDLEAATQQLARSAVTLPGGITVGLGAQVLGRPRREVDRRLRHLTWLGVARSRIDGADRAVRLLDPVAEAVAPGIAPDDAAATVAVLAAHLEAEGRTVRPDLGVPPDCQAFVVLDSLLPNATWLLDRHHPRGLEVAEALADHLGCRGHADEAPAWLEPWRDAADPLVRARAALTSARIGRSGGNIVGTVPGLVAAVDVFRAEGDVTATVFAGLYGAIGLSFQRRLDEAALLLDTSEPPPGPEGEWPRTIGALTRGWLAFLGGDVARGIEQVADATGRLERIDAYGASLAHYVLAVCLTVDPERGAEHMPRARDWCQSIGDAPMVAGLQLIEAEGLGDVPAAVPALRAAALTLDASGLPERAAVARARAGCIVIDGGDEVDEAMLVELGTAAETLDRVGSAMATVALAGLACAVDARDPVLARDLAAAALCPDHGGTGYSAGGVPQARARALLGPLAEQVEGGASGRALGDLLRGIDALL